VAGEGELAQARRRVASFAASVGLLRDERRSYCELVLERARQGAAGR
jgi:hypothetical protein